MSYAVIEFELFCQVTQNQQTYLYIVDGVLHKYY